MAKKEWHDQFDGYLAKLLELLRQHEQVNIGQRPYKDDFFRVFADAYRSGFCIPGERIDADRQQYVQCKSQRPLVCSTAIWSYAIEQGWIDAEVDTDKKRYRQIELLAMWWDEWVYAWSHNPPPRQYHRKK